MSAALDAQAGDPYYTTAMPGDLYDTARMQPFAPRQDVAWWQSLIAYGVTKAIDNKTAPPNVAGNVQPGSFAGANGRTYVNGPTGGAPGNLGIPTSWLLLGGAALIAYVALKG